MIRYACNRCKFSHLNESEFLSFPHYRETIHLCLQKCSSEFYDWLEEGHGSD